MIQRKLTDSEIQQLTRQGCRAADWAKVTVSEPFAADRVTGVAFSGDVQLGQLAGEVSFSGGVTKPCGIYSSHLHACTVGDGAYISNVGRLANYDIGKNAVIENVATLVVDGTTSFGNGTELEVLNEGGGRPLKIYDRLTAQIAYFLVLYRHNPAMIAKLEAMVDAYVKSKTAMRGKLMDGCRIVNCQEIVNVEVGPAAQLSGALSLCEGTIGSCAADPAMVGRGVIAKKFIILSGSRVEDGAILSACFVGQGVRMGKQYSAENSTFFANCEGFHGEACSLFAGPYTVTHHKSTLLIAGLLSFYNAGSGTNQSNHMYKLGPLHQGILERGSKTGSFSYLLWPCKVGPFSVVMGKHYANFDTSNLPFSYINEHEGKSELTPAMNLFTVGTRRDSAKWPARDRRKDPDKLDQIHFDLFNPFLVGMMGKGAEELGELAEKSPKTQVCVNYKGIQIKRLMLKTCAKYYEMAIKIYLGDCLKAIADQCQGDAILGQVKKALAPYASATMVPWVDVFGLLAPARTIEDLLKAIETGAVKDVAALEAKLKEVHAAYAPEAAKWFAALLQARLGVKVGEMTAEQLKQVVEDWKSNKVKLNNMIMQDAQKEFDPGAKIGFGIDGDEAVKDKDFEAVRGTFEGNKFIKELKAESARIESEADALIAKLK
jgi:NDP-sugar pyrophosphorylase family protein